MRQKENPLLYNELALAAITLGILSFVQLFGLEKSIAAIVFGILAIRRARKEPEQKGKPLAILGIALASIYTILAIAMLPHAIEIIKITLKSK